ncbi:UNVERIFIED_CONTAM: hypothetical protein PYX00_007676 [Menopon gallinae]|uniref:RNA helicase n=1 Tax=Menopon gallinae TaxID=328185 RepID=A0AAW2HK70_9NEOP
MDEKTLGFHEMEIDDRILKAIAKLGWINPTTIQERAIPLILEGKDVLLRARTGSGKTAAFAIPLIQKILEKKPSSKEQVIRALVLAPSKELCGQIHKTFLDLTTKCSRQLKVVNISQQMELSAQKPLLMEQPDIIVSTPGRVLAHLKAGNIDIHQCLELLVIDEADVIFSYGYENDIKELLRYLPKVYQAVMASATLTENVVSLKQMTLHNPVILKLEEPELASTNQLFHYHLTAEEEEKAVILYVLLKLNLIRGKTIIFVNSVDKCYRIKLYLEQFGIPSCVLNSELPASMRCHSVNQFNQGVYDLIIASDELVLDDPTVADKKKKGTRNQDSESGVARGIDFQFVSNILNFDFPPSVTSYIHRAGRTARGNNQGCALSFVSLKEKPLLNEVEEHLRECFQQLSDENIIRSYQFKMEEVEGFRYRARDAWKAVTKIAVREARLKEIRQEVLNSDKLKTYFENNPKDLQCLRHDKALHTVRVQPHLANVPEYIIPPSMKGIRIQSNAKRKFNKSNAPSKSKFLKKSEDPLVSLKFSGLKKGKKQGKNK